MIRFFSSTKRVLLYIIEGKQIFVNVCSLITDITEPERKTTTEPGTTEGKTTTEADGIFLNVILLYGKY